MRNTYLFDKNRGKQLIEYCFIADEQNDHGNPIVTNPIADRSTVLLSHLSTHQSYAVYPLLYTIKNNQNNTHIDFLAQIFNKAIEASMEVYLSYQ